MAIIGIVDQAELNGAICYRKYEKYDSEANAEPAAGEKAEKKAEKKQAAPAGRAVKKP